MDTHFFFAQELLFSSSLQIGTHVFFLKISMKLQVVDPIHKQINYVQSSIKST
jgi:hypothetical protein